MTYARAIEGISRQIEGVGDIITPEQVRMVGEWGKRHGRSGCVCHGDGDDVAHFHPSVEHMQFWCATYVSPNTTGLLNLSEPAEEQEEVANANALVAQIALCRVDLPESGTPAVYSWQGTSIQVGVKMTVVCSLGLPARKLFDQRPEGNLVDTNLVI